MDCLYTAAERLFLRAQQNGRLLSVAPGEGPELTAVLYQMHGDVVVAGGVDLVTTPAWAEAERSGRAVLVVDEIVAGNPPRSRGVRLDAVGILDTSCPRPVLRLRPDAVRSWGLNP